MEVILISVLLTCTLVATVVDLKKKEVPDFISYFLIIFGVGAALISSVLQQSIWPIAWSLVGASAFYAFGASLYYSGVWGGGDAKLLTGFGAVLANFASISAWPFLLTILFNLLLFGALFGILGSFWLAVKYKKKFIEACRVLLDRYKHIIYAFWLALVVVVVLIIARNATKTSALAWSGAVVLFYLMIGLKAIENACMYRKIKPSKLVEGDWLAEKVVVNKKVVYEPAREGISEADINKLVSLQRRRKLQYVTIKDGLPYVPAFLAAAIATLLGYDLMFIIFSSMLH